jgi:hypothetical protein
MAADRYLRRQNMDKRPSTRATQTQYTVWTAAQVCIGSCVTSIVGTHDEAQLYEATGGAR